MPAQLHLSGFSPFGRKRHPAQVCETGDGPNRVSTLRQGIWEYHARGVCVQVPRMNHYLVLRMPAAVLHSRVCILGLPPAVVHSRVRTQEGWPVGACVRGRSAGRRAAAIGFQGVRARHGPQRYPGEVPRHVSGQVSQVVRVVLWAVGLRYREGAVPPRWPPVVCGGALRESRHYRHARFGPETDQICLQEENPRRSIEPSGCMLDVRTCKA